MGKELENIFMKGVEGQIWKEAQTELQKKYHKCSTLKRFIIVRNEIDKQLKWSKKL